MPIGVKSRWGALRAVVSHRWVRLAVVLALAGPVLLLGLRWAFFVGPFAEIQSGRLVRVVDIHCHTAGVGSGGSGCFVSSAMQASYKFRIYLKSFGVDQELLDSEGDGVVIRRIAEGVKESQEVDAAIVLAMDGVIDEEGRLDRSATEFYVPNEFVQEETSRYPHLFWGASINPKRTNAVERLAWAHEHGAKFVKWLPSIQLFDPAERQFLPFYQKLVELDLPLLTHAGRERSFTHARDEYADPDRLKLALETGVLVIVAHIASTGEHEGESDTLRLIRLMKNYSNLYSEISSLTQVNKLGYLQQALTDEVFRERLFYGTDYPLINTALVSPWFFPLQLELETMRHLSAIQNPWDRDVALKRELGVPSQVFERGGRVLLSPEDFEVSVR